MSEMAFTKPLLKGVCVPTYPVLGQTASQPTGNLWVAARTAQGVVACRVAVWAPAWMLPSLSRGTNPACVAPCSHDRVTTT